MAIVEYIRYVLTTLSADQLIGAYRDAARHLDAAPECLGYDLVRCVDDPAQLILRIRWRSANAHLQGFRAGPNFPPFLDAIRPFIPEIVEMRHYQPTAVASDG